MAASQPFSLFPRSGVPKLGTPNPHKRTPSLHAVKTLHGIEETSSEPLPSNGAIPLQPQQPRSPSRSRTPSAENIGIAVTTSSPLDRAPLTSHPSHIPPTTSTTPSLPPPPPPKAYSPRSPPPSGRSGSATLVQDGFVSPIVPFRSIFPTYNPSIPLSKQSYYPQRPFPGRASSLYSQNVSRPEYGDSIASPLDRQLGARTAPPSVINFGDAVSISEEPQYSSHRELEKLWEASHGTEPTSMIQSFDLEMARTSEATFTFGADPQYPFYTLKTFDTSEIAVTKTNPTKRAEVQDVVLSAIEPPKRRLPPNDGLVAFIFPKMAAMLALNQSATLAKSHNLAPTDRDDVEAAAIRRAAAQEACHLRWNAKQNRYELEHPAMTRQNRDPNFLKSPASETNSMIAPFHDPTLYITITSIAPTAPTITITNPNTPSNTPQPSGIRLSTIPEPDHQSPLATLDLSSQSLHIDANRILTLMPSLFSIDSLVCALLAVAIADSTTNPILSSLPIWTARRNSQRPPPPTTRPGIAPSHVGSVKSYAGSTFFATLAEREEAEDEAKVMAREFQKDIREGEKREKKQGRRCFGGKRAEGKERTGRRKKVVIGEFDLEKLGHYQAGERKGEELPAVVRGVMGLLVSGLRLVTWLLTMIVGFVCWLLVGCTRCVTSEKF